MNEKIEFLVEMAFKLVPSAAVGAIVNTLMFVQKNSQRPAISVLLVQFGLSMFIGISIGYMVILFLGETQNASGWSMFAAIMGYKGMEVLIDSVIEVIKAKAQNYGKDNNNS